MKRKNLGVSYIHFKELKTKAMCFNTTKTARVKIAKKDIECWKFLNPDFTAFFDNDGRDIFLYEKGKKNDVIKIEKEIRNVDPFYYIEFVYEINAGYHSYKTEKIAIKEADCWYPFPKNFCKFIIIQVKFLCI